MASSNLEVILLIITAILLGGLVFLYWQVNRIQKRIDSFFNVGGEDFEGMIAESIKRLRRAENTLEELYRNHNLTQELARRGLHKVGFVRFNPFREIGGDQSFCIVFLDDYDNGIVISSLHGREGTRIFAKPLKKGISQYKLSKEEEEAIKKANEV